VICAVIALVLTRANSNKSTVPSTKLSKEEWGARSTLNLGYLILSFLSGFGTLALQVLYTRMFSLVFHNSTYTFGTVVAVFLASLAVGAAIAARLQRRFNAKYIVGVTTGLGACATAASVVVFVWLTELKYFSYGDTFVEYMSGAFLLVTVVVAPATICLGTVLPLLWTLAGGKDTSGHVVGKLTAVNTIAAAGGALVASFCLLVWVGLWQSVVLISMMFFVAAFVLLWQAKQTRIACSLGLLLAIISVLALRSPSESDRAETGERLIQRWNSPCGWIDVVRREKTGAFKIRQNLHYRFGTTGSNAREFRQAHIPLLLHNRPQDVLFMGLGTGLTAGGAIPHQSVKNIVAVELIPEVIEAARVLAKHNYRVVDHPKTEIYVDDARHHLLASDRSYDVIVSDLFVPWESESGYLYTVEHYQVARQRLKPGGLFCQWLPLYQLGTDEFESIANSFASVFPHVTIWWGQLHAAKPVLALVGTHSRLEVNADQLNRRIAELKQQIGSIDESIASADRFWGLYVGDWQATSSENLNTDEHPRVEFLTPISHRDKRMIGGKTLERYYRQVFSRLPASAAQLHSQNSLSTPTQRRTLQRLILFGR